VTHERTDLEETSMKVWKDIFWACALLFVIQLATTPFSSGDSLWTVARLVFSGLSLIPLYGYAYQVAIGNKAIAFSIFGLNAVLLTLALLLAAHGLITGGSLFVLFLVLLLLAVSFAFLYPQYRYAAHSDNLWDART
jgi:hypothetical protein